MSRIKEGIEWAKKKKKEGYEETPDGLLSKDDIIKAGYIWHKESKQYMIPTEMYISDGSSGRKMGTKYMGVTKGYLDFKQWKKVQRYGIQTADEMVEAQMAKELHNDEIDVDNIPF